jgi:hypothetical protein
MLAHTCYLHLYIKMSVAEGQMFSVLHMHNILHDNDFTLIINVYFYETFSTPNSKQ